MKKYNQFDLINLISIKEQLDPRIVKRIFKSAENIIYNILSSEEYKEEDVSVQPFTGVIITKSYQPKREYSKGLFGQIEIPEKIKITAHISRRYNQKINNTIFSSDLSSIRN